MNRSGLLKIAVILFSTALIASAETEEKINETRDAKPGGKLVIDVDFGSIDVAPGPNDKVIVTGYRKVDAGSAEKEKQFLAAAPVVITNDDNTVTVRTRSERNFWHWFGRTHTEALYTVRVPANFNATLDTAGGKISVSGITGEIKASSSGGNLKFEHLRGPLKAETSGGHIGLIACDGALDVDTSGGNIESTGGSGSLRGQTSGGSVTIDNFHGDTNVESEGGSLTLTNITGKLTGETSGGSISAVLSAPVGGDVRLDTSAGSIKIAAPADAKLNVDAETSAGKVVSELPVTTTESSEDGLKGTINGGGKLLRLRTSAGSIAIRSLSAAEKNVH